ncbi:alpha-farnesene synthase [Coffea arabica]|uniref:Alpha-farnesene synthase n=1 Tax=Coffea arabica TaxID=13443 RepID=A0A6P6VFD1_COFAR|nr:alpha-farnesene synthase-like [Coffea arabica]
MAGEVQYFSRSLANPEALSNIDQSVQRRTANYKPNIWKHELLQSLASKYTEEKYERKAQKLKDELKETFADARDTLSNLELVDCIWKLGLANYFQEEIANLLNTISSGRSLSTFMENDLYATALCFRILRQHGFEASQDMFLGFVNEAGKFKASIASNVEALVELFEASNLGSEGENILNEANLYSIRSLEPYFAASSCNQALSLPLHWTAEWYNIKKRILAYEQEDKINPKLVELAKLNFNIVQAAFQKDLKEISRWWMELGITEKLSFSRDRMVESFLYAGGVAFEPEHGSLRKWLSKVIKLVLIIDDVYDIYGSLEDLECFTNAVDRWMPEEVKNLPECMKTCFWTLYNTTDAIAIEIQKEKGWSSASPHLQKAWADFCKSLLLEAKWDNQGYTPSLDEYLDNASVSSSGPLLSLHVIFGVEDQTAKDVKEIFEENKDIIDYTSLIIRLCNDQGTSTAELERGDAPSSILCYMRQENVSEEVAREHIRSIIWRTWKKINSRCIKTSTFLQKSAKYIVNEARVAHFIYQHGDGFGVQDRENRKRVLSNLIEPLALVD